METYTAMRHFADSWGLLAMTCFFLLVVGYALFRPRARQIAQDAAAIPFREDNVHGR
ncbi:cbb3-type cytochrome c oxidase subunit 3 [Mangrovicella endophytica]|uniref:cbb3-type cytochrome c oxidase subunit 3 n=1 Tax=Mangrovicella endophytica TaxID=2066697 RepID=UPI000C9E1601|nr:cbb3-type cytochrome c oxidase subunit 3 [Mangrovicella endophytica]